MVEATEADVICPAIAAEDPEGLLGEVGLVGENGLGGIGAVCFESRDKRLGGDLGVDRGALGVNPGVGSSLQLVGTLLGDGRDGGDETVLLGLVTKRETKTVLCVVLEERVVPRGTMGLDGVIG